MSESQIDNPWTNEVCRDWINQEINRASSEVIEGKAMPTAVLAFVKRLVKEQYFEPETGDRATKWARTNLIANTRILDVDIGNTDR